MGITSRAAPSASGRGGLSGASARGSPPQSSVPMALTPAQHSVIRAVKAGTSLFFTGPAGSGKSVLLRELIRRLPSASTAVTASTGIAACNIGGITLHSWAGLGKNGLEQPALEVAASIRRRRDVQGRWLNTRVLVVDEISMVDGAMLDQLDAVAKAVRSSSAPFGGLQLVLVGDFYQLPPVSSRGQTKPFAFQSKAWKSAIKQSIQLTEVFRQADSTFVDILNEARVGKAKEGIVATKLMTHKPDVDRKNTAQLQSLSGEAAVFTAKDVSMTGKPQHLALLKANCRARDKLELKVGAQVMLIKSLDPDAGLVNGTRGVVHAFSAVGQQHPEVHFTNGQKRVIRPEEWSVSLGGAVVATRSQVPLELGWALSIHKSQGMTLTSVEVSLGRVFEYGQAYVALSRARSLEGLSLVDKVTTDTVRADPQVAEFYSTLTASQALPGAAAAGASELAPRAQLAENASRKKRSFSVRDVAAASGQTAATAATSGRTPFGEMDTNAQTGSDKAASGCTPQKKKSLSVKAGRTTAMQLQF